MKLPQILPPLVQRFLQLSMSARKFQTSQNYWQNSLAHSFTSGDLRFATHAPDVDGGVVLGKRLSDRLSAFPGSVITHLKGHGGAHSKPYRKIRAMHGCMWLFYKKHLRPRYLPPVTALVALGIGTSFVAQMAAVWARRAVRFSS